ncbi:MAG TPA: protease pro-enzyme activation domain-containing protein [Verrucomicrobiae bacterium]|nr:protease pro-enzyme activation domain-containing protein [Verrucomicrobiae bacterium]
MRRSSRVMASVLGLALSLTACSGGTMSSLPSTFGNTGGANADSAARLIAQASNTPVISVPKTFGALAFSDAGRRPAKAPVSVTLTLRYNHQAELDQFVANMGKSHRVLTPEQFNAYYAPTAKQEEAVVRALEAAGFTITHRYSNRTIVDAKAPSAVVEHFFSTEIHTVHQGKYGERFTNVRPAMVPASIARYVRDASLDNLVIARTRVDQDGGIRQPFPAEVPGTKPTGGQPGQELPYMLRPHAAGCTGQLLLNPGFESGNVDWTTTADVITDDSSLAYQGSWLAWLDGYSSPETDTLSQSVSIPAGCTATLTYYLYIYTSEKSSAGAVDTLNFTVNGTTEQSFSNKNATSGYVEQTVNLSSFAGDSAKLLWTSKQTGSRATDFFIDSTALTLSGGTSTPSPSPSPTAKPTATPTAAPTATPTSAPTATPTAHPTATPTSAPTATPTAHPTSSPTAAPTATPTTAPTTSPTSSPSSGCNGATADNGPLTNSDGTLATGVAKPFDYPVQHGCNGAGYTAAIAIDDPVDTSYVASYLSASEVTQTGTITNEAVDGGGSGDDAETDLDVQTISGLAPGANIIVYDMGSLADQNIEDTYNQALSDGKASAVNSSFGGCESSDTSFADSTNSIAEQGASEGVEFSASAGDSGSNECGSDDNSKGVSAPAGGPYFLSVGGINFTDTSAGVLETVTMGSESGYSGGGGVSTVFALPSYQSGIAGMLTTGRNQPDISLPFDPVAVYTGGSFGDYLGTSWSSPASVALVIEADELHASKLGFLNTTIYSLFSSTGYSDYFTPCTSGSNGAYSCSATEYNQAAGIGAPKGWALANAL